MLPMPAAAATGSLPAVLAVGGAAAVAGGDGADDVGGAGVGADDGGGAGGSGALDAVVAVVDRVGGGADEGVGEALEGSLVATAELAVHGKSSERNTSSTPPTPTSAEPRTTPDTRSHPGPLRFAGVGWARFTFTVGMTSEFVAAGPASAGLGSGSSLGGGIGAGLVALGEASAGEDAGRAGGPLEEAIVGLTSTSSTTPGGRGCTSGVEGETAAGLGPGGAPAAGLAGPPLVELARAGAGSGASGGAETWAGDGRGDGA